MHAPCSLASACQNDLQPYITSLYDVIACTVYSHMPSVYDVWTVLQRRNTEPLGGQARITESQISAGSRSRVSVPSAASPSGVLLQCKLSPSFPHFFRMWASSIAE